MTLHRFLWLLSLVIVCGCSDETTLPGDNVFFIVTGLNVESVVPSQYAEGSVSEILVACESRYAARAHILITGHNGGNDVGTIVSPVSGTVGSQVFAVDLPAGRKEIPIAILMTPGYHHIGLGIQVACDSVLIDNQMEYWDSAPAWAAYIPQFEPNTIGISNSSYVNITMDRAPMVPQNGLAK